MSDPAILDGKPVRSPNAPWPSWPLFDDTERTSVLEVLDSGKWWYGEKVREFEEQFAAFQDARFGVAGNNLRLTEFQAAILLTQLSRLSTQTQVRERNASILAWICISSVPESDVSNNRRRVQKLSVFVSILWERNPL